MHADAPRSKRQRDPAGADAEFQRSAAVARQLGEEVHGWLDNLRLAPVGDRLVVTRGDIFTEVVLGHVRSLSARTDRRHA